MQQIQDRRLNSAVCRLLSWFLLHGLSVCSGSGLRSKVLARDDTFDMGIDGRPMVQGPFVGQEPVPSHDGAGPYRHNAVTPVEIIDEKRRQRKGMQFCARLLFRAGNFVGEPSYEIP